MLVLVEQLPMQSRTKARLAGDTGGNRWGAVEHLVASLLDMASVQRIEHRVIAGDKKAPAFTPMERPGAQVQAAAAEAEARKAVEVLRRKPKGGTGGDR